MLSDSELRRLKEIERGIATLDPKFARRFDRGSATSSAKGRMPPVLSMIALSLFFLSIVVGFAGLGELAFLLVITSIMVCGWSIATE